MKADLSHSMLSAAPQPGSNRELESEREKLITVAETLVSDGLKQFIREVQRYAPPVEMVSEHVTVTVEGTHYAYPPRNTD